MALFNATYAVPPSFDIQAVEAGDSAEMVTRLTSLLSASPQDVADFKLAGAGSGPLWEAWLVRGDVTISVPAGQAQFVAAVAGNPAEALFYLKQRLAAAIGSNAATVYKVEVAGAGDGPTYMAAALFSINVE
jgi:hypothetical protein